MNGHQVIDLLPAVTLSKRLNCCLAAFRHVLCKILSYYYANNSSIVIHLFKLSSYVNTSVSQPCNVFEWKEIKSDEITAPSPLVPHIVLNASLALPQGPLRAWPPSSAPCSHGSQSGPGSAASHCTRRRPALRPPGGEAGGPAASWQLW